MSLLLVFFGKKNHGKKWSEVTSRIVGFILPPAITEADKRVLETTFSLRGTPLREGTLHGPASATGISSGQELGPRQVLFASSFFPRTAARAVCPIVLCPICFKFLRETPRLGVWLVST